VLRGGIEQKGIELEKPFLYPLFPDIYPPALLRLVVRIFLAASEYFLKDIAVLLLLVRGRLLRLLLRSCGLGHGLRLSWLLLHRLLLLRLLIGVAAATRKEVKDLAATA
jgi:hypothetical protein